MNNLQLSAIIAIVFCATSLGVKAQDCVETIEFDETIVTDRPDQTEAPNLVPKGWLQLEVGSQKEVDNPADGIITESALFPTTLLKYGLSKHFELRLISEYQQDQIKMSNSDGNLTPEKISGMAPIAIGCKIRLREEDGIKPKISLISHLELPYFGKESLRSEHIIPRFRFLFAHTISEKLSFSYNLGGEWEDGANNSTFIYTASLGYKMTDRLGMFIESYGFLREYSAADNRLDGGLTFLATNNFQFDVSGGIGISENSPDYFLSCGASFRINTAKK